MRLSAGLVHSPRLAHLEESLHLAEPKTPTEDKAADEGGVQTRLLSSHDQFQHESNRE